jgi:RNA polymerase sigma-70 factor (ECF subfamily)
MSADEAHGNNDRLEFATTQWTLVMRAGQDGGKESGEALAQLCGVYWYPLYAYVRRRVNDVHEARDFTQAFFTHLLEKDCIADADQNRGRFRAFLLTACKRFLINEWHKARAAKRGGGRHVLTLDFDLGETKYACVAVDGITAEQFYDRQWAIALLDRTLERLREDFIARNRLIQFETLKPFLAGSSIESGYAEAARALGIKETAAKVAAHRMRSRYRELLRSEIAQTVRRPEDIDDEIRDLFTSVAA